MDWNQEDRSDKNSQLPLPTPCCPVDLKLSHVDCSPGDTLVHFQGQYVTICELDYNILQVEIQNARKKKASVAVGEICLVEDVLTSRWYRGRVQDQQRDLSDVFLLDYGNVLTVRSDCLAVISDALLLLPPRIVCGFFANVLPVQECWNSMSQKYFCSLIGTQIKGYVHALLPYKVLLLEVPEITKDLLTLNLGRRMDTATFLLLVKMLLEAPIQQNSQSVPDLLNEKQTTQECPFRSSTLSGFENIISLSGSKLAVGQQETVKVTAAVNPGLFYCQLSSAAKDLKEMSEKLASACELRSRDCGDKAAENLGLLCAVKGKDGRWHRGFVQCLPVNSVLRVVFVDYGYCESVKVENVLQLPLDFLRTPIMAYPCSLSCLNDTDKDRKSQQLVILRSALLGKELAFKVDGFSKAKNVFLVTLSSVDECTHANTVNSDELTETCILKSKHIFSCCPKWCTDKTKEVKTFKDSHPFEDIQEGSKFKGYVEYVQNPHNFWIRTGERSDRFENMMNKLADYFSSVQLNEEILDDPVPGVLCCAMYEQDMHYYRARVVETLENGAQVFFIDFGNTEKVPSMLIKKLPSDFAEEPQFAFNCSLAHIAPLDDCWTVEATDYFRNATSNKALVVHVLNKKNDSFVVELYDQRAEKFESITALMTKAKMAESWKCNLTGEPAQGKNKTNEKKSKNPCKSVSQKHDSKGTTKEIVADRQALTDTPESKAIAVESFRYHKIMPGSELSVLCSHVTSPYDFWCQNKKQKEDLDRLMEKLQDFYRTHTPVLQQHSICCAIKFQEDNRWYRGSTIRVKNEEAEVILIDYGIVVRARLQNICALMPEFLELNGQAFRCSLCNLIEPVGKSEWSKEACTLLKDFVSGNSSNLTCKIYSQLFVTNEGLYNVVDLQTPLQWASAYLVQKRVAIETKCPKQLLPSAYPFSFVYSSFNICVGSEELVYATHVVSPWEIYLQLDRNTAIIDELMERTTKVSEELLRRRNGEASGSVCLAKFFDDSKWYRSFAWPAQSSQHLNVFFVDYGNKQVVEKRNILPIPRKAVDLLLIPMQALRCCLLSVPDEEHLPEVNAWLKKTIINKALMAKFVAKDDSGNFICDLFDGTMHINEKMNDLFAILRQKDSNSDCCKEGKNLSSSSCKSKNTERCQVETAVNLHKTSDCRKVTQGNSQSYQKKFPRFKHNLNGSLSKENQNRDIHNLQHKGQARGLVQKREKGHTPCTFNGRTSKVFPKASDLPEVRMKPGFRGVGFISHCHSPDRFFIQMKDDEQTILKIGKELNNSPFTANLKDVTSEVNIGDLVAARYEEDLALYRAVVTSVVSSDALRVQFVDYGNSSTIDRKDIHLLTSQFLSHARLSIPCLLSKSCGFQDSESFIKETHDKPLIVEFVKNLGYAWEVCIKIFDSLHESRIHCADDGENEKVPSSTLCRPCNSEINKAEKSSIEEDTKKINKVGQQKCLEILLKKLKKKKIYKGQHGKKRNGSPVKLDAPNRVCYLEKRTPHNSELNVLHGDGIFGMNTLETSINLPESVDVRVTECQSVLEKLTLADTYLDDYIDKNDQVHLVLAPVQVDFEYSGFAAAVTTPSEFYIVLEDLLLMMNTVSNILEDLPDVLSPLPETHLISGTGCLVKSGEKNKWCRAEIVQCNDISVVINLVDYGHYAHFSYQEVDKLKRLPRELAVLPKITYPCLLRGVKPAADNQWSDNAVVFFQECMCQKGLQIYFREYVSEAQWEVDVVTGGRNVAKELVDAGHASYIDSVLGIVSCIMNNVPEAPETSSDRQTQSIKEELLQGNLEEVSLADNSVESSDKMPPYCARQGRTENNFSKSCDLGLGQMTCHGSSSGLRKYPDWHHTHIHTNAQTQLKKMERSETNITNLHLPKSLPASESENFIDPGGNWLKRGIALVMKRLLFTSSFILRMVCSSFKLLDEESVRRMAMRSEPHTSKAWLFSGTDLRLLWLSQKRRWVQIDCQRRTIIKRLQEHHPSVQIKAC